MSQGAGAVLKCKDPNNDVDSNNVFDWMNYHFVCDYIHRPKSSDVYAEEMLMMTLFYSCYHYPERNKSVVYQHFIRRGYHGFLLYPINPSTGSLADKPGFYTGGENKQGLFDYARNYIEYHVHKEKHLRVLDEFVKIKGLDDMTNRDLFVAATGCLDAQHQIELQRVDRKTNTKSNMSLDDYF